VREIAGAAPPGGKRASSGGFTTKG
jgi:hypothetical protein